MISIDEKCTSTNLVDLMSAEFIPVQFPSTRFVPTGTFPVDGNSTGKNLVDENYTLNI